MEIISQNGFVNLTGNENIYKLTRNRQMDVYFNVQSATGAWFYSTYSSFNVGSESDRYRLDFMTNSYRGTIGK